ncbi:MAG TPA: type I methionyl aminopeptidase [Nitrospirae bacterium]|nr:type I methionyl aminopeptidase [Nitrospirota bacterium]
MIPVKSREEIKKIRRASQIVAEALSTLKQVIAPGITTKELEQIAEEVIRSRGGVPAFKGYRGYPASICASVNDEVVHGIPSIDVILREGDIISIDLGVIYEGLIGDAAMTVPVGRVDKETERLIRVTEEALYKGIKEARISRRVGDISHAIQRYVESHGFSVVRAFVGHGVGRSLHEEPQIPNFGYPGKGPKLKEGMTLAIEPMVNAGTYEVVIMKDGWTAKTADGSLSAHFEHTVLVTRNGPEILTKGF